MTTTSTSSAGRRFVRALYRLLWRLWRPLGFRDNNRLRVQTLNGVGIIVLPGVFDGIRLRTGAFLADTINVGPGQRFDVIWPARQPGKWLIHCHIGHHTTNNNVEMSGGGGLMMIIDVSS